MLDTTVKCPDCGLEMTLTRTVSGGRKETTAWRDSGEFALLCKHREEDNGPYDCRILQAAKDATPFPQL
jgi:hypothetical protein